jgi:hypothetical protein
MPERFALPIHAFMLTGNLYRLQIETPRRPMAQPVLQLLGNALGYNRRHRSPRTVV